MFKFRGHLFSIAVAMSIGLHLFWAALILFGDGSATAATSLYAVYVSIGFRSPALTAVILLTVAHFAIAGMWTRHRRQVYLLLPQQIVLCISLFGAVEAIWLQQFADGVVRPFAFIAADQIDTILLAMGHTAAIIAHWYRLNEE